MRENAELILKQRAHLYARPPEEPEPIDRGLIAVFRIGRMRLGFDVKFIDGIYRLGTITPIPCTPPFILGAINVNGRVCPLIDISALMGESAEEDYRVVVMIRSDGIEIGIPAADILGVEGAPEKLSKPEAGSIGSNEEFIDGITQDGVLILNLEELLKGDRLIVMEEV